MKVLLKGVAKKIGSWITTVIAWYILILILGIILFIVIPTIRGALFAPIFLYGFVKNPMEYFGSLDSWEGIVVILSSLLFLIILIYEVVRLIRSIKNHKR